MKRILMAGAVALALGACATTQEGPSVSVRLDSKSGSKVTGQLTLAQAGADRVRIAGELSGHTAGPKGFHIHEKGDCSAPDAMSAGGHFNPTKHKHGGPGQAERHAGDLGNIVFDSYGKARVDMVAEGVTLEAGKPTSIRARSLVVHVGTDDLKTDPTGNSGGRVACGVIPG